MKNLDLLLVDNGDNMINVKGSSHIDRIGYDADRRDLQVEFLTDFLTIYIYHNVEQHVFNGLVNAKSKGKYMNDYIYGKYKFTKLRLQAPYNIYVEQKY